MRACGITYPLTVRIASPGLGGVAGTAGVAVAVAAWPCDGIGLRSLWRVARKTIAPAPTTIATSTMTIIGTAVRRVFFSGEIANCDNVSWFGALMERMEEQWNVGVLECG